MLPLDPLDVTPFGRNAPSPSRYRFRRGEWDAAPIRDAASARHLEIPPCRRGRSAAQTVDDTIRNFCDGSHGRRAVLAVLFG